MYKYFHWYGFLIGVGILSALQVSLIYAKRVGVKKEVVEKSFWWVLGGGIIGARVYHVVDLWQVYYRFNYLKSLFLWEGGLGIWGGIVGGVMGVVGYHFCHPERSRGIPIRLSLRAGSFNCKSTSHRDSSTRRLGRNDKTVPFLKLLDVVVIGVPLGQAIGRLGNWVNNELYGKNGEPLFAWEAGLSLLLFGVLWKVGTADYTSEESALRSAITQASGPATGGQVSEERSYDEKPFAGKITGSYLVGYGLIRILLENFRPNEIVWKWQGVPVAVIMGVVSIFVGGIILKKKQF